MKLWQARIVGGRPVLRSPRAKAQALQDAMVSAINSGEMEEHVCPVSHHFFNGTYGRFMFVKAGVTVAGKVHRHKNALAVLKGECLLFDEGEPQRVKAPFACVSEAGTKRALHAITDTVVVCFHETEKTDLVQIEADVIVPEPAPMLEGAP